MSKREEASNREDVQNFDIKTEDSFTLASKIKHFAHYSSKQIPVG